jgi:hypothetical protein
MQPNPDVLHQVALQHQRQLVQDAERAHLAHLAWPPAWRDPAIWSAILGPIIGTAFLVYFARVILAAVSN